MFTPLDQNYMRRALDLAERGLYTTTPNPRVLVSSQPTVAMASVYTVAGCALPPPPAANGPCVTGQFITAATRITSLGQPLLLFDSQSICTPTGTPLLIVQTQTRVIGT